MTKNFRLIKRQCTTIVHKEDISFIDFDENIPDTDISRTSSDTLYCTTFVLTRYEDIVHNIFLTSNLMSKTHDRYSLIEIFDRGYTVLNINDYRIPFKLWDGNTDIVNLLSNEVILFNSPINRFLHTLDEISIEFYTSISLPKKLKLAVIGEFIEQEERANRTIINKGDDVLQLNKDGYLCRNSWDKTVVMKRDPISGECRDLAHPILNPVVLFSADRQKVFYPENCGLRFLTFKFSLPLSKHINTLIIKSKKPITHYKCIIETNKQNYEYSKNNLGLSRNSVDISSKPQLEIYSRDNYIGEKYIEIDVSDIPQGYYQRDIALSVAPNENLLIEDVSLAYK